MSMTPEEIADVARLYLPDNFLRGLLRTVFVTHGAGWDISYTQYATTEAMNVVGFNRRAAMEGALRDLARMFPGIEATVERSDSPWFHTEIRSGPIVLTESAVQFPCDLVRKSDFRLGLASSPQLEMAFGESSDEPVKVVRSLYAVLVHSPSRWDDRDDRQKYGRLPGSAFLAFPRSDLESYALVVDLFNAYPDIVASYLPNEWNQEARLRYITRSRRYGIA